MKRIFLLGWMVLLTYASLAQDSLLVKSFNQLFIEKNDRRADSIADALVPQFSVFLKSHTPENYDFSQIPHLGVVASPDGAFRLYMYNIIYRDGTARHFGYIQQPEGGAQTVTFLNDKREEYSNANTDLGDAQKWYGALYYQIIPNNIGGKIVYTLLGNSYNNLFTTRKVAEVLTITPVGVIFGMPLFYDGKKKASRIVFEYSARISMTLKYFPETKYIVFDHLVSSEHDSKDFQFYGPDGSQDGFILENGMWILKHDIDFKQPKQRKAKKKFEVKTF